MPLPLPSDHDASAGGELADALDRAVRGEGLVTHFQPIVRLDTREVVGFEALARWPALGIDTPLDVFARAEKNGGRGALDRLCVTSAIEAALAAGIGPGPLLLINTEPDSTERLGAHDHSLDRARRELRLGFELTERTLLVDPHALLRKVDRLRADGFVVALDDVGSNPHPLALLDVVCPDLIKLDLHLVQAQHRYDRARTISAVMAHQERTGAVILAEGIETDEHLERAQALGAAVAQGFAFGPARPLPAGGWSNWLFDRQPSTASSLPADPFEVIARHAPVRTARKRMLIEMSRHIEAQAAQSTDPPIVFTALQHVRNWTPRTRRRYHQIAATAPLVAIFARGLDEDLGWGVRGVDIAPDDELAREWTLVVLGAHTATALIARALGDDDRTDFEFAVTHDRHVVTMIARCLLDRMTRPVEG